MKTEIIPTVGMGATLNYWSDRSAGTIIQVERNGKRIIIQMDKSIRTDQNGMSECQDYEYQRDEQGDIFIATLRKDGRYRVSKSSTSVSLDVRSTYYDYSF